jgi:hypothetical protein
MEPMHYMFPEDEIFMCAMVLLYGVIAGGAARLIVSWRARRTA